MRAAVLPFVALAAVLGFAPAAEAQQLTRRELRQRCLAQCDRMLNICLTFMHHTAQECAPVDNTCKQRCDTEYPPPPGEPPAALPPGTTLIRPPVRRRPIGN